MKKAWKIVVAAVPFLVGGGCSADTNAPQPVVDSGAPVDMTSGFACDRQHTTRPCLDNCDCNVFTWLCSPIPQRADANCDRNSQ